MESAVRNTRLIRRAFKKNLLAAVLGTAVTSINAMVGGILMGNFIGAQAMAVINLTLPVGYLLISIECFLAAGGALLASRAIGARDQNKADGHFSVAICSVLVVGLSVAILSLWLTPWVTSLICSQESLMADTQKYCGVQLLIAPITMMQLALSNYVQQSGHPADSLKASAADMTANLIAVVLFIKVLGMDLTGAAFAAGTGGLVACVVLIASLVRHRTLKIRLPQAGDAKLMLQNIGAGCSSGIQTIAMCVLSYALNYFIQINLGSNGAFVLSVGIQFLMFALFFAIGVQTIFVSMGCMMQGQGDDTGIVMLFKYSLRISAPFTLFLTLVQILFPRQIASLYGASTQELLSMSEWGIRIIALYGPLLAFLMILLAAWQVRGYFQLAAAVSASMLGTLPLCLWAASKLLDSSLIWVALPASALLTTGVAVILSEVYRHGNQNLAAVTLLPISSDGKQVFEGSAKIDLNQPEGIERLIDQAVQFFESLNLGRHLTSQICHCMEEVMILIMDHGSTNKQLMDLRVVADEEKVSVLVMDDCSPYNPLNDSSGELRQKIQELCPTTEYRYSFLRDTASIGGDLSGSILHGFCPGLEYRNSFGQNMTFMEWMLAPEEA